MSIIKRVTYEFPDGVSAPVNVTFIMGKPYVDRGPVSHEKDGKVEIYWDLVPCKVKSSDWEKP